MRVRDVAVGAMLMAAVLAGSGTAAGAAPAVPHPIGAPSQAPSVPVEPSAPSGEPSAPSGEPSAPSGEPSAPSGEPSAPSEAPSVPDEAPSEPSAAPSGPSDEPSVPSEAPSAPSAVPSEPVAAPAGPTVVKLGEIDGRKVIVDGNGRALYAFTNDKIGDNTCTGGCATTWPPLTGPATAGHGVHASDLKTITRSDGVTQVTYYGDPLYRYAGDSKAGDGHGEDLGGSWFLVNAHGKWVK